MMKTKTASIFAILLLTSISCSKFEVENSNLPDRTNVLDNPEQVKSMVQSSFLTYWQAIKSTNLGLTADVMADHSTCFFGNFEWRHNVREPRLAWDPFAREAFVSDSLYFGLYKAINNVNDALFQILLNDMQVGDNGKDNPMIEASSYFIRGLSLGQLGLTYDKSLIILHDSDMSEIEFKPWQLVIEAAIDDLEKAIEICKENEFEWPAGTINGMSADNIYIAQLANSYAARFLSLAARNKSQNDDLSWISKYSWEDVKTFALNGIETDFAPFGNGLPWNGGTWWDLNVKYLRQPIWAGVDCRVINLLDPQYPIRYPTNSEGWFIGYPSVHEGLMSGEANSQDNRFNSDFQFFQNWPFFISTYMGWVYTHYRHSRYDYPPTTNAEGNYMGESIGPLKELTVYDNQLMLAEAYLRTNMISEAAEIINNSSNPRKVRGGLSDIVTSKDETLEAIFYERDIELFLNGYLIHFCDMRRRDMLQHGTPLHFPIPANELIRMNLNVYTFGGVENADGVNTSNGGDWIMPYYHFKLP